MTETNPESQITPTSFGVEGDIEWSELPQEVQIKAISEAISVLASEGYSPFAAEDLSEALGPDQLRLVATSIQLSDEELETVAENLSLNSVDNSETVSIGIEEKLQDDIIQESERKAVASTISLLFDAVSLVGLGIALLLIVTTLIYESYILSGFFVIATAFLAYSYRRGLKE
jgi:hypothetical protein